MSFAFLPDENDLYFFHIQVLIVANEAHGTALKTALLSSDLIKEKPSLKVHQAENFSVIPKSENIHLDFLLFVVDCRFPRAVKKVYEDVRLLPPELAFERFCVINASFKDTDGIKYLKTTEKLVRVFARNFNVHVLNGEFDTVDGVSYAASRVIRLMSRVMNFSLNESSKSASDNAVPKNKLDTKEKKGAELPQISRVTNFSTNESSKPASDNVVPKNKLDTNLSLNESSKPASDNVVPKNKLDTNVSLNESSKPASDNVVPKNKLDTNLSLNESSKPASDNVVPKNKLDIKEKTDAELPQMIRNLSLNGSTKSGNDNILPKNKLDTEEKNDAELSEIRRLPKRAARQKK